jgi:hypothetical protein
MELCLIWRLVLLRRLGAMEQSDPFPQDLAVMGFDNTAAAKLITRGLLPCVSPWRTRNPWSAGHFRAPNSSYPLVRGCALTLLNISAR